jgi:hypothetical protein
MAPIPNTTPSNGKKRDIRHANTKTHFGACFPSLLSSTIFLTSYF